MRRIITLTICIVLIISTVSCSTEDSINMNHNNDNLEEITIAIEALDYSQMEGFNRILFDYTDRFKRETGVKVNFDQINSNSYDDYLKKLNAKLYLKDGPTLILISDYQTYKTIIDQGVGLELKDKVPNYSKIYGSLLDDSDCFVPIGVKYTPTVLNKNVLDELGIEEPSLNWIKDDYLHIRKKWLEYGPRKFTRSQYWELVYRPIQELKIIDEANKKVDLNNSQVKEFLKEIKDQVYSGKYALNPEYTFENYHNMIFNSKSKEYKESREYERNNDNKNYISTRYSTNPLRSFDTAVEFDMLVVDKKIVLPYVIDDDSPVAVWGFIVNRNGKNTELGLDYINGLLSEEIQLEMFQKKDDIFYPVNKDIEDKINKIEEEKDINKRAIALRKYIINQIKEGTFRPSNQENRIYKELVKMIGSDFAKFIFADEPYTDEELSEELQKLENKYNMWLNE